MKLCQIMTYLCLYLIMHHLTSGISSLLHSVNLILFTVFLVHLILCISPHHSHHLHSHHLSQPFNPDLIPTYSLPPVFLVPFGLPPQILVPYWSYIAQAFVYFSFFFHIFLYLVTSASLRWLPSYCTVSSCFDQFNISLTLSSLLVSPPASKAYDTLVQ